MNSGLIVNTILDEEKEVACVLYLKITLASLYLERTEVG
jgi:hypothetical protein